MKNYTSNKIGKTLNFDDLESVCGGGPRAFYSEYHGNHSNGHLLVHSKNE